MERQPWQAPQDAVRFGREDDVWINPDLDLVLASRRQAAGTSALGDRNEARRRA
jgi:hypothetical protein